MKWFIFRGSLNERGGITRLRKVIDSVRKGNPVDKGVSERDLLD